MKENRHFYVGAMSLLITCPDKTAGHSWLDSTRYNCIHDNQEEVTGNLAMS